MKIIMPKVVDAMYEYVDDHVDIQNVYSDLSPANDVVAIRCCKIEEYIVTINKKTKKQLRSKRKSKRVKVVSQDIKGSIMDITLCGMPTLTNEIVAEEKPLPVTFFLKRTRTS